MISSRKNSTTSLTKASDTLTVRDAQSIAGINREEPKLVEVGRIKNA